MWDTCFHFCGLHTTERFIASRLSFRFPLEQRLHHSMSVSRFLSHSPLHFSLTSFTLSLQVSLISFALSLQAPFIFAKSLQVSLASFVLSVPSLIEGIYSQHPFAVRFPRIFTMDEGTVAEALFKGIRRGTASRPCCHHVTQATLQDVSRLLRD